MYSAPAELSETRHQRSVKIQVLETFLSALRHSFLTPQATSLHEALSDFQSRINDSKLCPAPFTCFQTNNWFQYLADAQGAPMDQVSKFILPFINDTITEFVMEAAQSPEPDLSNSETPCDIV